MKFSVLMPVYEKVEPEQLKLSIESLLKQTMKPNEIVIIKDGKLTKQLDEILEDYKEKYQDLFFLYQTSQKLGVGLSLQKGVKLCKNEYIARMDADDICLLNRFEKQFHYLEENKEVDICGSWIEEYDEEMKKIISIRKVAVEDKDIKDKLKIMCAFNHMTIIFKKSIVMKVGNYRDMKLEDYDLFVRLAENDCIMHNLPECLVKVRGGESCYERRSGMPYIKGIIEIQNLLFESGYINFLLYLINMVLRVILAIVPRKIKTCIYPKIVRKIY